MSTKLSPATKRNVYRIIPFGIIWLIFSIVYTLLERGLLGNANFYATGNPYSFSRNIFITPITALIMGLLIGTVEILYFSKLFMQKSFGKKIVYKSIVYLGIILLFLAILTVVANAMELNANVGDKQIRNNVWKFFTDYAFISVSVYMTAIIVVSQFYSEISESIGQGVLANFFTGKYHSPREEERIYMFLDMRSSTTIAEQLGHVRYFEMLREYYADLSGPVVQYAGEIYQYIGDEMVVSWKLKNGLQNNNCIQCFFAMKEALQQHDQKYSVQFGVVPSFKAGLHFGKVTTGEIGVIKKDIIFTGDVLNTTARIQGLCNSYDVDILISDELRRELTNDPEFQFKPLGKNELRGRDEKIGLFTILSL